MEFTASQLQSLGGQLWKRLDLNNFDFTHLVMNNSPPTDRQFFNSKSKHFEFPDTVKRLKIDIGLAADAYHSAIWALEEKSVGVLGVEPNPENILKLLLGLSGNAFNNLLYLQHDVIGRAAGYISEIYLKDAILGLAPEGAWAAAQDPRSDWHDSSKVNIAFLGPSGKKYSVSPHPLRAPTSAHFLVYSIVEHIAPLGGRYILLGTAIDNLDKTKSIQEVPFYATPLDPGTSSLRKEIIDDYPEKGAAHEIRVPCVRLSTILEKVDWERFPVIDCIKIDTEGKELDVLKSADGYYQKIVYLRVEMFDRHELVNNAIMEFLQPLGFTLFDTTPGDYKFVNERYRDRIFTEKITW